MVAHEDRALGKWMNTIELLVNFARGNREKSLGVVCIVWWFYVTHWNYAIWLISNCMLSIQMGTLCQLTHERPTLWLLLMMSFWRDDLYFIIIYAHCCSCYIPPPVTWLIHYKLELKSSEFGHALGGSGKVLLERSGATCLIWHFVEPVLNNIHNRRIRGSTVGVTQSNVYSRSVWINTWNILIESINDPQPVLTRRRRGYVIPETNDQWTKENIQVMFFH